VERTHRVVGVVDGDEVGDALAEYVSCSGGPASGGGVEKRPRHRPVGREDDLPRGLVHRGRRPGVLGVDAAVELTPHVRIEVEVPVAPPGRQGIRARRDGLGFQCLGRPRGRHLARNDAVQILLETDDVDHRQAGAVGVDDDIAPVGPVQPERARAGIESDGRDEGLVLAARRQPQVRSQRYRSRSDLDALTGRIRGGEGRVRGDLHRRPPIAEEHTQGFLRDIPEGRPGIVVSKDAVERPACLRREPVRTALAETDAVAGALAAEDERHRPERARRERAGYDGRSEEDGQTTHHGGEPCTRDDRTPRATSRAEASAPVAAPRVSRLLHRGGARTVSRNTRGTRRT
jgi:hypothetical protein